MLNKIKNLMKNFVAIFFYSIILISCSGGLVDDSSWSGKDKIAGVGFSYTLETKPNNTYKLVGNAGGMSVNERGTFMKINDNEIILTSGEFEGCKFVKVGSSLKWYLDNGDYFMTLN
jgi:hypothetical protein